MKTQIKFNFIVPVGLKQKFYTIRLHFVDPYKFEKFDNQILIGFCQIKPGQVSQIPNFEEDKL